MKVFLFKWLAVVFSVVLVSSFVSMMAAFVGSKESDLRDLIILQTILIPLAVAVVIWAFAVLIRRYGYKSALGEFWNCLPR